MAGALVPLGLGTAPAGATDAGTEQALRDAFGNPAETLVSLTADITLADCTAGGGDGSVLRTSSTDLVLEGNGFTITQTCSGANVLRQSGSGKLTIGDVTLAGGRIGVGSSGPVSLSDSIVQGQRGDGPIGVSVTGATLIERSTITDVAADTGTAAGVLVFGTLTMRGSTVSGIHGDAFGVFVADGSATILNSTITGVDGPAILGIGDFSLGYVDIVGNGSQARSDRGQAYLFEGDVTMFGSVIAKPNDGVDNCGTDLPVTSNGYNFADDESCGLTATGDRQGAGLDPLLGALANNGGRTPTFLPQTGSPLLDAIPEAACQTAPATGVTTDQRGLPRPAVSGCDIGSVEVQPAPEPAPTPGPAPVPLVPNFPG